MICEEEDTPDLLFLLSTNEVLIIIDFHHLEGRVNMAKVLIVGAGPTGLTLAYELTLRGIPVRLIDQSSGISIHSKALGLQSRTLEMLEKMGLIDAFLEKGLKAKGITYHWKNKQFDLNLDQIDAPYPFLLILPQKETENILLTHLEQAGVQVEWKTKLLDIIDGKALIERPGGAREVFDVEWIVGADGAHSQVRHSLKFPFKGTRFPESFLLADVEGTPSSPIDNPHLFLSKKGFGVVVPLPAKNYRLIFPLGSKQEPKESDLPSILKERQISMTIHSVEWFSIFHIDRRMTSSLRKENIFLAGDAAHIHSPAGGQGMNTGLQDAMNLAWKLDLTIKGVATDALLDSYEIERLFVAKSVLKWTTYATKLLTSYQKWFPEGFFWLLQGLLFSKKRRQKIAYGVSQLAIYYPQSFVIKGSTKDNEWKKGPKPGERAPDAPLSDGSRLFEKLKTRNHVLLLFAEYPDFCEAIRQEYGKWIDILIVFDKDVQKKYGASPDTLYVIRPDGYIGFRSKHFNTDEVISYLLRIFKPSSQRNLK